MTHYPPVTEQNCGNCYAMRSNRGIHYCCRHAIRPNEDRSWPPQVRAAWWCAEWSPQEHIS